VPHEHRLIESEESFFAEERRAPRDRKEGIRPELLTRTSFQSIGALLAAVARKLGLR